MTEEEEARHRYVFFFLFFFFWGYFFFFVHSLSSRQGEEKQRKHTYARALVKSKPYRNENVPKRRHGEGWNEQPCFLLLRPLATLLRGNWRLRNVASVR